MMRIAFLLSLSLTVSALAACEDEPGEPPLAERERPWSTTIAFAAGVKLGGCAVGDVDPDHPGNEIAAVAVDGRVFLVRHADGRWTGAEIAKVAGEMIQCAIGDAVPQRPGHELVVVGMARGTEGSGGKGAAHVVFKQGEAWTVEAIAEDDALIHGVCVGKLDPQREGHQVATVGFSRRVRVWHRGTEGWAEVWSHALPAPGKTAVVYGDGVAVANTSQAVTGYDLVVRRWSKTKPERRTAERVLGTTGVAQARIATDGKRLLVACDDGTLQLITDGTATVIHRESQKLRGAVLADVDPRVPGIEAATAGYAKALTLLYPPAGGTDAWRTVTLWRDTHRFHHLAAGELHAEGLGLELVAVGYSGRVIVSARTKR